LGRKLTVMDGLNGMMRKVRNIVKPGADKDFLKECLTPTERKHIAPAKDFHFAVVSARRATNESGQHDIMVIEGHFKHVGLQPIWYVDEASLEDYRKLGLNAKVGGKLTPARNMALDDARAKKRVCVQVSDDISKWIYYDIEKQDLRGEVNFKKANAALAGTKKHVVSPLAAAQFLLAKMRADPDKPHLGGVFPTMNAAMTLGTQEYGKEHFILGDFFVAEPSSPCRFDTTMTLKEDYDYTCSHLATHGSVLRCNRLFIQVKHATNVGGAVATRDAAGSKEKQNIAILQSKWPGVFTLNGRRKDADSEVVMRWRCRNDGSAGQEDSSSAGKKKKITLATAAKLKKGSSSNARLSKKAVHGVPGCWDSSAILRCTEKQAKSAYINKRCRLCDLRTVGQCLGGLTYKDSNGNTVTYQPKDLKYDLATGRLKMSKTQA